MSKLFLRWIAVFGLLMMSVVPSWGDTNNNGSCNKAESVTLPYSGSGTMNDKDKLDYYSFTAPSDGVLSIAVTGATTDVDGYLQDDACLDFYEYDQTLSNDVSIVSTVSAGQTYKLRLESYLDSGSTNYTLNISFSTSLSTRTFTKRDIGGQSSTNIRGNLLMIGNQLLCKNSTNGGTCTVPTVGATNNSINQHFANVDTNTTTSGIVNSSMARLDMQTGDTIIWARLYWSARMIDPTNTEKTDAHTIKFRTPSSSAYQNITAENFDYFPVNNPFDYGASADVTSLVQAAGAGQYYGANIQAHTGENRFASWMLLVAVQNNNRPFNNLSVYDGFQVVFDDDNDYPSSVSAVATGFLTPKTGTVTSNLFVYTGESEAGIYDGATITNKAGTPTSLVDAYNTANDLFNGTASSNGVHRSSYRLSDPGLANPNFENLIGTDLDKLTVTNLNNEQTQTTITISSTGGNDSDRYSLNMFAFETKLYEPRFCYDYGYEQNGVPFTEENTGTQMPYISGFLPNSSDINVSIYIKNQENSDISANNVQLSINDINTSSAIYKRNSVAVTFPNNYTPTAKTDAAWPLSVSDEYVRNIPLGNMGGSQYAYAYYGLTPQASGNIQIPIVGTFSYDLVIPLPNGTTLTLPYSSTIGGTGLPMCSSDNFSYTPEWGIFSVVDAGLYSSATANRFYNLTTQVAKRPGNMRIASFDANLTDVPKSISTTVAVELIDASLFHDVDAACHEPSSAITPRVWVTFDNNVSQVDFNRNTINTAIANGAVSDGITGSATTLASAEDFFKTASSNAAYRVSFNVTNDGNESLIQTAPGNQAGNTQILNFTQLVQDIQHCAQPVEMPSNASQTTTLVSVACGNAGNQGIDKHHLAICMECLYGYNTNILCSRDNFAIRPESYNVKLKDIDNTTNAFLTSFATDRTGVTVPNTARVDVSGGYNYNFEINATNHIDNSNTAGYTRNFITETNDDFNISLIWEPATAPTTAGCNDTNSVALSLYMGDGATDDISRLDQVGEYRLNIMDKSWTEVDWDPAFQAHQAGSHFLTGDDCLSGSTSVPLQASVISLSGGTVNNLVGCNISSNHDNIENNLKYRDYLMTFHPHHFNLALTHGLGLAPNAVPGGGGFIYDSDLSNINDMNMSVRSSGTIGAVGFTNGALSNFVKDCYAKDLNISLGHNANTTLATPFVSRVVHSTAAGIQVFDSNETAVLPNTMRAGVDDSNFTQIDNGSVSTVIRLNFDRNQTTPLNPQVVTYGDINVSCSATGACSRQADGTVGDANGTNSMNFNVAHVYGRIIPRDVRVFGPVSFSANAWYEVFNTATLLGTPLAASRNEALWYINSLHTDNNFGDGNVTVVITGANPVNTTSVGGLETYNFNPMAVGGYKAHINTEGWLWNGANALGYLDPVNATNLNCLTHPCFNIMVVPAIGATGSAKEENESTKDSKATRGTGWRSTSDYAPAIR